MKAYLSLDFMLLLYAAALPSLPQLKPHPKENKRDAKHEVVRTPE
jgi:hypothetical protein